MSGAAQDAKPYARCNTCGIDLPTKADQRAHMDETMTATGELGITARSHSTKVVNPTSDEVELNRLRGIVDNAVEDAARRCCEDLDDEIRRGYITEEQVTAGLRYYSDFADAWADWLSGADA